VRCCVCVGCGICVGCGTCRLLSSRPARDSLGRAAPEALPPAGEGSVRPGGAHLFLLALPPHLGATERPLPPRIHLLPPPAAHRLSAPHGKAPGGPPWPPRRRRRRREDARTRSTPSTAAAKKEARYSLSSLMLTTGTPLMLEVHQSLAYYICKRLADPATEHLQFELSDSTVQVCM
jgi:hypothetical protein